MKLPNYAGYKEVKTKFETYYVPRKFGNHTLSQNEGIQNIQRSMYFRSMPEHTPRCAMEGILVLMEKHSAG